MIINTNYFHLQWRTAKLGFKYCTHHTTQDIIPQTHHVTPILLTPYLSSSHPTSPHPIPPPHTTHLSSPHIPPHLYLLTPHILLTPTLSHPTPLLTPPLSSPHTSSSHHPSPHPHTSSPPHLLTPHFLLTIHTPPRMMAPKLMYYDAVTDLNGQTHAIVLLHITAMSSSKPLL